MTITRSDVADLRPGDVVEITEGRWTVGTVLRGPLWAQSNGTLWIADSVIRASDGRPINASERFLTVVSRAPRPLYVNSDRAEPVPGDVARDEEADGLRLLLRTRGERFPDKWIDHDGYERTYKGMHRRLRLLVDGETGQVVP